jgi:hypothetical protein
VIPEFTLVVALDLVHAEELRCSWPTWDKNCHLLRQKPMLVLYDPIESEEKWRKKLEFLTHPRVRLVPVRKTGAVSDQREMMLTSFVLQAPFEIKTPWYLKLDTDVVATSVLPQWPDPTWFLPDEKKRLPAFISNPWPYSKPANVLDVLDDWGDTVPELKPYSRLNVTSKLDNRVVVRQRIISWCFFGNTNWSQKMAEYTGGRLPVPSHDTYLWYCAERRRDFYRRARMKRYGWDHIANGRNLKMISQQIIGGN